MTTKNKSIPFYVQGFGYDINQIDFEKLPKDLYKIVYQALFDNYGDYPQGQLLEAREAIKDQKSTPKHVTVTFPIDFKAYEHFFCLHQHSRSAPTRVCQR